VGRAHTPERTCVGCRGRAAKRELIRMVREVAGTVALDATGTAPGRGAYVHPAEGCIEAAIRTGALVRALRTGIGRDELGRLRDELQARTGAG
jgi:hypothetical protein